MKTFKVSIKFTGNDHAFIVWTVDAVAEMMLMEKIEPKIKAWLDAKGLTIKEAADHIYTMWLVAIEIGTIEVEEVEKQYDEFYSKDQGGKHVE